MIQLLNSKEINKEKWDACIQNSNNPLFYFLFDVIDIASNKKWEALVEDDYKNVFPLPYNSKLGIKYYYTPLWIQRLGWINNEPLNFNLENHLNAKYIDLFIQNHHDSSLVNRTNYILNLKSEFKFSSNTNRNLKKAKELNYHITEVNVNPAHFVDFFKINKGTELKNISTDAYNRLAAIITILNSNKMALQLTLTVNNKVLNNAVFVKFGNRFTYFKGCGTEETKNTGLGHLLIEQGIQKAKELNCTKFDFYGGNSTGMAQFYSGFGAQKEDYKHLLKNNLPKALRWLKKN